MFFLAPNIAAAADIRLTPTSVACFADVREGISMLTQRDDYIRQMSPFDRQVRLKADRRVTEEELLAFMSQHVQPWSEAEIARLTPIIARVVKKIAPWRLNLPATVLLVKTDGREESGAAYCRGPAIVLPQNMIDAPPEMLDKVLPHEFFHVLSSHNPELRERFTARSGFTSRTKSSSPRGCETARSRTPTRR